MVKFSGINHLAMVTDNMNKTIRFWRDLLEMRMVASIGSKDFKHYFFEISSTDMIAFFEWPGAKNIEIKDHGVPLKSPLAFDHVAISVDNDKDLVELKNRLEAAGFWVSDLIDHGFIHSIYTFDPNNIPLEFSARVTGVDIKKEPKLKDKNPPEAALEGSEPQKGKWPAPPDSTEKTENEIFPGHGKSILD